MEMLVTIIKSFPAKGRTYQAGEFIRVKHGQRLIDKGYARHLNTNDTAEILDEYVQYAKKIFKDKEQIVSTEKTKYMQGILF
jgi:hypothetical protein